MTQVLVAEDVAAISLSLQDALEDWGYTVAGPFTSGSAAMQWLETGTPDLALLDWRLSDGPCIELARLLRSRNVPVLVLSGATSQVGVPPDLRDMPWLEKPISEADLMSMLRSITPAPPS